MRSALDEVIEWKAAKLPPRAYTRPTPSAITLVNFYLGIIGTNHSNVFRKSLDTIAREAKLTRASVRRGNECLRQLGWLSWDRGYGFADRHFTNAYTLGLAAIQAYQKAHPRA